MAYLPPKPSPYQGGEPALHPDDLNAIIKALVRQLRGGRGVDVRNYGDRVSLSSPINPPSLPDVTNYIQQFQVVQDFDDFLLCMRYVPPCIPGTAQKFTPAFAAPFTSQNFIWDYVAKPYLLQRTPWDKHKIPILSGLKGDALYTTGNIRVITDPSGNSVTQVVAPIYYSGEIITAVTAETGYTVPKGFKGTPGTPICWLDINTAGRVWGTLSSVGDTAYLADYPIVKGGTSLTEILVGSNGMPVQNLAALPHNLGTPNASGYYNGTITVNSVTTNVRVKNINGFPLAQNRQVFGSPNGLDPQDNVTSAYLTEAGGLTGTRIVYVNVACDGTGTLNTAALTDFFVNGVLAFTG